MAFLRRVLIAVAFCLVTVGGASAATLTVPDTHGSLAAALAAARPGDVIEIAPGIYREHGLRTSAAVTIRGLGALPDKVVIDGGFAGRILECAGVDGTVVLQNLTLRNGRAQGKTSRQRSGGAILVADGTLVLQNCVVTGNEAGSHGGAIRFIRSSGRIVQTLFADNTAALGGGAIDCSYDSSPKLDRCELRGNTAAWGGALSIRAGSSPCVIRSLFNNNRTGNVFGFGGAVFADLGAGPRLQLCTLVGNQAALGGAVGCFQDSHVGVDQCTVVRNSALAIGGGLYCIDAAPWVTRSIVAFNTGTGVESVGFPLPQLGCSNLYGNTGGDTRGETVGAGASAPHISADPQFCGDAGSGTHAYVLAPDSPGATAACGLMGAWPAVCDMPQTSTSPLTIDVDGGFSILRWTATFDHPGARFRLVWSRAGGPERELLFDQTIAGEFLAATSEPAIGDPAAKFRLYVRDANGMWIGVAERGYADAKARPDVPAAGLAVRTWPNPFNPRTTVGVRLGRPTHTRVAVYDLDGRLVRMLADRVLEAGETRLVWDGRDDRERGVAAGAYLVRVQGEAEARTHKITLLK